MIHLVQEVQSARTLDLRVLFEFLGILYFELKRENFIEYTRLSKDSVLKFTVVLKVFKSQKILVKTALGSGNVTGQGQIWGFVCLWFSGMPKGCRLSRTLSTDTELVFR